MSKVHQDHPHQHGSNCEHTTVSHQGHLDYLHDGHLHHQRKDGTVEEHRLEVSPTNPAEHKPIQGGHAPGHVHGPGCGHEAVPHGDHTCYLVDGKLHHPHDDHCDDHGPVEVVS